MFAIVLFILFMVAVGILYFMTKQAVSPEQAAADVEAKTLVDNAEAVVTKDLPKL